MSTSVAFVIGGRSYEVGCRPGEAPHFQALARLVDAKAREAAGGLGSLTETRQLLYAALLLADELIAAQSPPALAGLDEGVALALERLADRVESLADGLEAGRATA